MTTPSIQKTREKCRTLFYFSGPYDVESRGRFSSTAEWWTGSVENETMTSMKHLNVGCRSWLAPHGPECGTGFPGPWTLTKLGVLDSSQFLTSGLMWVGGGNPPPPGEGTKTLSLEWDCDFSISAVMANITPKAEI